LGFDGIRILASLLAGNRFVDRETLDDEMRAKIDGIPGSKHDLDEATNHILVSNGLRDETLVCQLHSMVMHGLLRDAGEGLPGEYRRVSIGVQGSRVGHAPAVDLPPLMSQWCEGLERQRDDEHLGDFLTRIHSRFQYIHPFVDGNGRIGRLVMNLIQLKRGYPLLAHPTTLSSTFNLGVELGHMGYPELFSRLLAEGLFASFRAYEAALDVQLLPRVPTSARRSRRRSVQRALHVETRVQQRLPKLVILLLARVVVVDPEIRSLFVRESVASHRIHDSSSLNLIVSCWLTAIRCFCSYVIQ